MQDRRGLSFEGFCREYITGWWGRATYITIGFILVVTLTEIFCYLKTSDEVISNNAARKFYQELLYSQGLNKPYQALALTLAAAGSVEPNSSYLNPVGQIIISEAAFGRRFPGHLLSYDGSHPFWWRVNLLLWSLASLFGAMAFMRRAVNKGEDIWGFPNRMWVYLAGMAFFPATIGLLVAGLIERINPRAVTKNKADRNWSSLNPKNLKAKAAWKNFLAGEAWTLWAEHLRLCEVNVGAIKTGLMDLERRLQAQQGVLVAYQKKLKSCKSAEPPRNHPEASREADADYDRLMALPAFREVVIVDNTVTARIGPCHVRVNGKLYDLGDYSVSIHRLTGKLTLKVERRTIFSNYRIHPYAQDELYSSGIMNFCFGDRSGSINNLIELHRYLAAIALIIESLHHINPGDEGMVVGRYPIIKEGLAWYQRPLF